VLGCFLFKGRQTGRYNRGIAIQQKHVQKKVQEIKAMHFGQILANVFMVGFGGVLILDVIFFSHTSLLIAWCGF